MKLFGADDKASFEALATVLTNVCRGWFELFPSPPLRQLAVVENLLAHHDPELHLALSDKGTLGTAGAAWTILQTLFSEVRAARRA